MGKKYKYRIIAFGLLCLSIFDGWKYLQNQIPDQLTVASDGNHFLSTWMQEISVETGSTQNIECRLLGIIPLKEVQVDVVEREKVIPGGVPVGIYLKTAGVLVVGTEEVCDQEGNVCIPVKDLVKSGDYILEVNDVPVSEKEEVIRQINETEDQEVKLKILRETEEIEITCPVVQTDSGEQKAGIWIRDDAQGIGTLTYIRSDGSFGALGHGISDIDTSTLLTLEKGKLYRAQIKSIVKGISGMPGELAGMIRYQPDQILGDIVDNTEIGIFGNVTSSISELNENEEMEVAYKQEIKEGAAVIRSAVSGELQEYDIEIEKIHLNSKDENKSMVIRVTDPQLLALTGGIVQGMSGSPILQDGKIMGAVTHVLVNDPTRGYGIFIENMLEH